jgi:hypothetical protein
MFANLKFTRSAAKAANAAHAYNACWCWRSLLALPARSVRRLLNIGLRIVVGCWFTTEGACSLLISLWFRARAYTNDRSCGEGLAGPRGSVARNRVFADPNMRPFSGLGNWDRCCETLVWGMEEGRWRMRCNCDGNASTLKLARFPCVLWIVRDAAVLSGTAWLPRQLAQKWGPIAADNVAENGLRRHTFPATF